MSQEILKSFSNKTRLQIMLCLSKGTKNVSELIDNCNLSQSAVSQHLSKLKESGMVKCNKQGKEVYYELVYKDAAKLSYSLINFIQEVDK